MRAKTALTDKPISFKPEMIRAILDGRKRMTRRLVKPQPDHNGEIPHRTLKRVVLDTSTANAYGLCPYGPVGRRLWVKETWGVVARVADHFTVQYDADKAMREAHLPGLFDAQEFHQAMRAMEKPWRPARFMPKWAARLWLEVTGIRVERVQEITEDDAIAEGVRKIGDLYAAPWVWVVEFDVVPPARGERSVT